MTQDQVQTNQKKWLCNPELSYFLSSYNKGINPFSLELTWRFGPNIDLSNYSYTDIKPKYPKAVWSAISTITLYVHLSYKDPSISVRIR